MRLAIAALCLLLPGLLEAAQRQVPDPVTQAFLRRPEFEQIQISPDGSMLAIARRLPEGTVVSVHRRDTMAPLTRIDPGAMGEVGELRWLDDERLLVAANRANKLYGVPLADPALYIVRFDGKDMFQLPANFVSTIAGDPDHLLVSDCEWKDGGCVPQIRRADINRLRRLGEVVTTGPAPHSAMFVDQHGAARMAISVSDDGNTKAYFRDTARQDWVLINDATRSGVDEVPIGVSGDGRTGYIWAERKQGPDAIVGFDLASGNRTELLADTDSDPIRILHSIDGSEPIGAVFGATQPRVRFWNTTHPDAVLDTELQRAFPGRLAHVVSSTRDARTLIVWVTGDRDPGSFYQLDRASRKAALITRAKPWLATVPLAEQTPVALTARDGLPLHGLLTRPAGAVRTPMPMVVLVHGGPYGVTDSWGFDPEVQLLAAHGYAVLQVNFRGSGGYGREFRRKGYRQWGRAMQDDVTDATRWAIAQGLADPSRVAIYGASYGGYAALMGVIREPGLYRCAVALSGVYDLAKLYRWGNIRRSDLGRGYLKEAIGEDKDDLASRSPVQLAGTIEVPLLLAHGRLDGLADVKHARALKRAARRADKGVELVEYEYAGHSLVRDEQVGDFYARMLAFLDTHLAPPPPVAGVAADQR